MRLVSLLAVIVIAGCQSFDKAPAANIPAACDEQVYADPHVKDLLMKGAGSPQFERLHEDELKYAKVDAARRCMQAKGLTPLGGGVQRPTVLN